MHDRPVHQSKAAPFSRRTLLAGAGASLACGSARANDWTPDAASDGTRNVQTFYGPHQSGITTPQPAAALYCAFDVLAERPADLERLLRVLTERLGFLTQGGTMPAANPQLPPRGSGILGPTVYPDNLTATVSLGASLFDYRFGLDKLRPRHLGAMERFQNDALDPARCHGDLMLQLCSNTAETNIHALRDVIKNTSGLMAVRWKIEGFLPPHIVKRMGADTVRNMLGFKDGTANLDARDATLMDRYVWIGQDHINGNRGEPAWTAGGSYQVVRIIRTLVERWDRTPLSEQEAIIGRHKGSGAPLGQTQEREAPAYDSDPLGERISLAAHIRLANPRLPETESSLILRRSYNYSQGISASGQLDMGLLFACYQADLTAGFVTVQNRLTGEQMEEYVRPIGGGYFFAPPGATGPDSFLGQGLLAAV